MDDCGRCGKTETKGGITMTARQENNLNQVRALLKQARNLLDGVMFGGDPLTDAEFKKVRGCFDKICEANDKI